MNLHECFICLQNILQTLTDSKVLIFVEAAMNFLPKRGEIERVA